MYRESDITKPFYYIGEACEIMGISISTFRNYDKKGLIKVHRGSRDRRIIDREDLIAYLKENSLFSDEVEVDERRDIIYTRVSSADQKKNGDLDRQTLWIVENAPQLRDPIILSEVGSGLNDHRKKLTEMIRMIEEDQIRRVIDSFLPEYSKILMFAFVNLSRPEKRRKWKSDAALNTEICHRFGVLKRTANSAIRDARGRIRALLELKKTELESLEEKIKKQKQQIKIRESTRDELKPKARTNSLNEEEAQTYKNVRASLYHRKNRLNQLNQQVSELKREIAEVDLHMCFGTKKLFKAQYHLEENHIPGHDAWKRRFVKNRDKNLYYLGAAEEVMGNGLFQLRYDEKADEFTARVRIQNDFKEDAFLTVEHLNFKRRRNELIEITQRLAELPRSSKQRQPLSYRIKRRGNQYYLQVIFTLPKKPVLTRSSYGVIGLDYNNGFIEAAETNRDGNLVDLRHYPLEFHGTGNKAASELQCTVHEIVNYALERGKDIVIEDLDFKRKKAECKRAKSTAGKRYNRMIHAFDYSRYGECMERACFSDGVHLMAVNPAYTSRIGKEKYQENKKLTVHQAAAYIIARRGQMFSDELIK